LEAIRDFNILSSDFPGRIANFIIFNKYYGSESDVWLTVHRISVWIRKTN